MTWPSGRRWSRENLWRRLWQACAVPKRSPISIQVRRSAPSCVHIRRSGFGGSGGCRSLGLGGCLADDMGLGKTIQVIALLVLLKKKGGAANEPSLLVVPASLIANWRAEIARFAPEPQCLRRASFRGPAVGARFPDSGGALGARRRHHDLRHLAACRGPDLPIVERRRARRGSGHQEPGRQADSRGQDTAREDPPGADGHAGREPIGRSLVAVRFHLPWSARFGQGIRSLRQVRREARSRRLRPAARAGPSLHSSTPEE